MYKGGGGGHIFLKGKKFELLLLLQKDWGEIRAALSLSLSLSKEIYTHPLPPTSSSSSMSL
jgi:hypothetical protein